MSQKAVALAVFLIGIIVVAPLAYGASFLYAVSKLEWHIPTLTVSRDGWNIRVNLNFKIENPTSIPLPTLKALINVTFNGHSLFYAESREVGSLGAHSTTTITLSTTVNFNLFGDLFWTLVDYLSGKPVTLYAHFKLSFHLLVDFPVLEKTIIRTFELY